MLNIAICDDNIDDLSKMADLVDEYRTAKHLNCEYAVFQNGFDLISSLDKGKKFNLYLLDIILPAYTGIEVAKEIREFDKQAAIVFFTTSPEFALEGYSVNAVNYVLKPVSKEKLFITLDRVLEQVKSDQDDAIVVKSEDGIQKILLSNLVYVEVVGRKVLYHLISGKIIECIESFAPVCDILLNYSFFIRTHRSYVVNINYIDNIGNKNITLQDQSSIPIAQGKAREIKDRYLSILMEEE